MLAPILAIAVTFGLILAGAIYAGVILTLLIVRAVAAGVVVIALGLSKRHPA